MREYDYFYKFNYDTNESKNWTGRVSLTTSIRPCDREVRVKIVNKYDTNKIFNIRNIRRIN